MFTNSFALITIWASMRENLSSRVCEQQRHRPACASTQFDQCPCNLLIGKYHNKTCNKPNFTILASLCSWAGWFGYDLFGNPKDRFLASMPIYGPVHEILVCIADMYSHSLNLHELHGWKFSGLFLNSGFWGWLSIESQPQNTELSRL